MRFVEVCCGEPETIVTDYARHYRSGAVHLVSPDYAITRPLHAGSWPTGLIIDRSGIVRHHETSPCRPDVFKGSCEVRMIGEPDTTFRLTHPRQGLRTSEFRQSNEQSIIKSIIGQVP